MNRRQKRIIIVAVALLTWSSAIAAGLATLHNYENTPGALETSQRPWPTNSELRFASGRINLVMLAHPRCPCTRASLDELRKVLNRCKDRMTAHVLFRTPTAAGQDWTRTELWDRAAAIPGVQVHADVNGAEARRFGATTSGHAIVFQEDGTRIFSGGLTVARGRAGNGEAATEICKRVNHKTPLRLGLPVFGCPLFDSQPTCNEGALPCLK